nr:hypothetical protein B24H17.50 [imported] - Neurospora crassa [Neurospora crassa]
MLLRWYSSAVRGSPAAAARPIPGLPTHNPNTNCVGRYDEKKPIAIFPYRAHAIVVLSFDRPAASDIDKTPSPSVSCRGDRLEGKIIGLDVAVLAVGISAQPISTPFDVYKQPAVEVIEVKKLHAVLVIAAGGDWKIPAQDPPRARAPREAGAGSTKCARGITTKVGFTLRFHLVTTEFPCRPFLLSRHDCEKIDANALFLGESLVTPVSEQAWRFVPSWEWSSAGSSGKYVSSGLSVVCGIADYRPVVVKRPRHGRLKPTKCPMRYLFCVPVADGGFQVAACPGQLQVSPNVASSCPSIGTELVKRKRGWEGKKGGGQRSNNWKAGPDVRKVESAQEREKKKRMEERKGGGNQFGKTRQRRTEDGKGGRGARGNLNDRSDFLWSAVGLLQVKKMAGAEHTREVEAGQAGVPGPGEDCTLHGDGKCNLEAREGPCPTGSGRA